MLLLSSLVLLVSTARASYTSDGSLQTSEASLSSIALTSSGRRTPDPMTIRAETVRGHHTKGTYNDGFVVLENPTAPCGKTNRWVTRPDGHVVPAIFQDYEYDVVEKSEANP